MCGHEQRRSLDESMECRAGKAKLCVALQSVDLLDPTLESYFCRRKYFWADDGVTTCGLNAVSRSVHGPVMASADCSTAVSDGSIQERVILPPSRVRFSTRGAWNGIS